MKRLKGSVLLVFLITVIVAGCGTEGSVSDKEVDIKASTPEGNVESKIKQEVPTEEELGLPIYPNAEVDKDASGTIENTTKEGTSKYEGLVLITGDDYNTVVNWYRERLSGMPGFFDMTMGQSDSGTALFSVGTDKEARVVTITEGTDGKTQITVASATR